MRCDFADSLLQGYFDGELSGRRAAEFERHLRHCAHCATELVDLDLLRDRLQLAQLSPRNRTHDCCVTASRLALAGSCGRTTFCRDLTVESRSRRSW